MINFKQIHIGNLLKREVEYNKIDNQRICNFFKYDSMRIEEMYRSESIDLNELLKWSKLLEYDFFRIYSQHLILYSPPKTDHHIPNKHVKNKLPNFRKSIYTKELIDFIIELVSTGKKTRKEVVDQYKIPKTTLYKWLQKYNEKRESEL
ncbi:helix-turn-helix domain-containing protein [Chryseobacterium sp. RU33C]|uniref:helix-turn-helix domain-containing protein n=1 Tax=unclassified Chryseobacterium TaxID=2593645 RepID=UPI000956A89A|nr:helix-turn-helix domain-containing protein [Chryseobacterium sp. RU33C]SIQ53075.1 Helix-turn-helix domain of resolvase [Chryseobacterium sp. RU33C]